MVGVGAGAAQATWSAVGTVKNANNSTLSGVAVTVKDSSANLKTTTDGNGTFVIGTATGILASAIPTEFSVRQNGNELQIAFPGEGTLDLRLVDLSGSTLWMGAAPLVVGYAKVALPASEYRGAAILRVSLGNRTAYQPLTLLGAEGIQISTRIAARSLDNNPTLVFKKVGYADTTFTMNAPTQTGISVVMRDSTIHLPPQPQPGIGLVHEVLLHTKPYLYSRNRISNRMWI